MPTISRDANVRPAIVERIHHSCPAGQRRSAAADEVHDFDLVALHDRRGPEGGALDDQEVALDGHAARIDLEPGEQFGDRERAWNGIRLAVQCDGQSLLQKSVPRQRIRETQ